ncbi:unnamed protein product [Arabis nemorensis]|uniref:Uncharacterized protein n=1 Tax=Arabis nemorensis TaxID=586526 RepID=A0A565AU83_9BRAS|nr:unnamed protein product [Arabis nemorensis]
MSSPYMVSLPMSLENKFRTTSLIRKREKPRGESRDLCSPVRVRGKDVIRDEKYRSDSERLVGSENCRLQVLVQSRSRKKECKDVSRELDKEFVSKVVRRVLFKAEVVKQMDSNTITTRTRYTKQMGDVAPTTKESGKWEIGSLTIGSPLLLIQTAEND